MIEVIDNEKTEKIWLIRRVIASCFDYFLVSIVFVVTVWIFLGQMSDHVRIDGLGLTSTRCENIQPSPSVVAEASKRLPRRQLNAASLCETVSYGLLRNRHFRIGEIRRAEAGTTSVWVNIPVNLKNEAIEPWFLNGVELGLLAFLIAAGPASSLRASPGLWLMRRQVEMLDGSRLTFRHSTRRMLIMALPVGCIYAISLAVVWSAFQYGASMLVIILAILAVLWILALWCMPYRFGIGTRKAMLHDQWSGSVVRPRAG